MMKSVLQKLSSVLEEGFQIEKDLGISFMSDLLPLLPEDRFERTEHKYYNEYWSKQSEPVPYILGDFFIKFEHTRGAKLQSWIVDNNSVGEQDSDTTEVGIDISKVWVATNPEVKFKVDDHWKNDDNIFIPLKAYASAWNSKFADSSWWHILAIEADNLRAAIDVAARFASTERERIIQLDFAAAKIEQERIEAGMAWERSLEA
jgi:hypothetical protein